jgi:hypothetical protein
VGIAVVISPLNWSIEMQVKKFVVASWESNGCIDQIVGVYDDQEEARKVLAKCIEGDDKHDPLDYTIMEKTVTVS